MNYLGLKITKAHYVLQNTCIFELIYPFNKFCILSQKPTEIHLKNKILHADGKPAIRYADNFDIWCLNGVKVPQWLAVTQDRDIDPHRIIEIKNAEVRREFVRKVGIDRICYSLKAKMLDKQNNYELLLLNIKNSPARPYLKMLNPSINTWHVEGVHPNCKTVRQALAWRNNIKEYQQPIILT